MARDSLQMHQRSPKSNTYPKNIARQRKPWYKNNLKEKEVGKKKPRVAQKTLYKTNKNNPQPKKKNSTPNVSNLVGKKQDWGQFGASRPTKLEN